MKKLHFITRVDEYTSGLRPRYPLNLASRVDKNLVYLLLPLGISFVILSFISPQLKIVQAGLAFSFIYLYIGFSLLHHRADKSLTLEVTIEYILIATLTVVLLLGIVV